jgi:hypothetical protein
MELHTLMGKAVCGESRTYGLGGNVWKLKIIHLLFMRRAFTSLLIGTAFLIVCFFRIKAHHFTKHHHNGFEAAI